MLGVGNTSPTVAGQYVVCHKRMGLIALKGKKHRRGVCGEIDGTLQSACRLCLFVCGEGQIYYTGVINPFLIVLIGIEQ